MTHHVLWVEIYDIQVDAAYAVPVRYSEPACEAIKNGNVRLVTEERAAVLNERFIQTETTPSFDAKTYLDKQIVDRWIVINRWKEQHK